jgi:hypothetical protein
LIFFVPEEIMTTILIVVAALAAIYLFAAVGFYQAFNTCPVTGGAKSPGASAKGQPTLRYTCGLKPDAVKKPTKKPGE